MSTLTDHPLKPFPYKSGNFWSRWSTRRKVIVIGIVLIVIIALAVGIGVGVTQTDEDGGDEGDETSGGGGGDTGDDSFPPNGTFWRPTSGTSWQIVLRYPLNDTSPNVDVYDIDLFDNEKSVIDDLHSKGRKVICYFSAGSYENWRPDKGKFQPDDLGNTLDGWPDERWLDLTSRNVRSIMVERIQMCADNGYDGIDPDNVDGYDNDSGLDLTTDDSADFMEFLADETHKRNMSIGLKNAGALIERVLPRMQWSVNEQCVQYDECDTFQPFIDDSKPVFHIEYPDDAPQVKIQQEDSICQSDQAQGFSTVIKEMDLTNWLIECPNDSSGDD